MAHSCISSFLPICTILVHSLALTGTQLKDGNIARQYSIQVIQIYMQNSNNPLDTIFLTDVLQALVTPDPDPDQGHGRDQDQGQGQGQDQGQDPPTTEGVAPTALEPPAPSEGQDYQADTGAPPLSTPVVDHNQQVHTRLLPVLTLWPSQMGEVVTLTIEKNPLIPASAAATARRSAP